MSVLLACATIVGAVAWLYDREVHRGLPSVEELALARLPVASEVFATDGTLVAELSFEKRYVVPLAQIPIAVRRAFLAAEDATFYSHDGFDLPAIIRAAWKNLLAGDVVQGGSTITQQVVKSLLLTPARTYERKIKEMILAHRLERQLTKDQILFLYLNDIYLGSGAYGVEAAAREYFGKPAVRLTLAEAALLAGLPKAPSRYSPRRHPELARKRQRYVLRRMEEEGFISAEERRRALSAAPSVVQERSPVFRAAPDYVEHVRRALVDRYGDRTLYRGGFKIFTALDLEMQHAAETALRANLRDLDRRRAKDRRGEREDAGDPAPAVEGAILAMESTTGFVRAMVGGYDFGRSQFNRAVQARRQPGSAFKPFVYAAALDHGYTPASIVVDSPIALSDGSDAPWRPENFDRRFLGPTRLREALARSRNVVSVKLARRIGLGSLLEYLPRFGFSRRFPRNLSIALGSAEVTLLELVRAYAVFASGGRLFDPAFVLKVTDRNGHVLEERRPSAIRTMSQQTAYLMTSMLESVVRRGTGRRAHALGRPAAGKTGTSNDTRDAWFVGFTPRLVAGAWVGFDDNRSLGSNETGARAALPVWLDFMQQVMPGRPVREFTIPEGIVLVNIDPRSGRRASLGGEPVLLETFRRGSEPPVAESLQPNDFFRADF